MIELALVLLRIRGTNSYVLQRRDLQTKVAPGKLGCFGGHVEPGEDPFAALKREIGEETSLDADSLDYELIRRQEVDNPYDPAQPFLAHVYRADIADDQFEVYEGQYAETYTIDELKRRDDLSPSMSDFLPFV